MIFEFEQNQGRLPPEGSIREAIITAVWLRRQEIEVNKVRVFAQGFADLVTAMQGSAEPTQKVFKAFVQSMFPFMEMVKGKDDKDLIETMKREIAKGPLEFTPRQTKLKRPQAKTVEVAEDFKRRLAQKKKGT